MQRRAGPVTSVVAAALAAAAVASCSDSVSSNEPPPVIRHLGVDFGRYDAATGMAGGFDFHTWNTISTSNKVFVEFGGDMNPDGCPPDCWLSGHMLYRLAPGERVYAPIDGYVTNIFFDDNWEDYEIGIAARRGRTFWFVVVDHVLDVRVSPGQQVSAGDWIASAGNGPLEIDLSSDDGRTHCMLSYFDPATKALWAQRVSDLMADWEAYMDDASLYDQAAMVEPGCLSVEFHH